MPRRTSSIFAVTAAAVLAIQACGDHPAPTESGSRDVSLATSAPLEGAGRYVMLFTAERVPANVGERVSTLGGSVEASLDAIGVAAVTGLTESAAAELATQKDIRYVERDVLVTADDFGEAADAPVDETSAAPVLVDATSSPTSAQFYPRQWNMQAVFADKAWEAGHLGARDVVVAILDGGIDYLHPDLEGLVDLTRSKSFSPEDDPVIAERFPDRLAIADLHGHGTAVASIVASNAKVLAGVNREVTLVAVKVFNHTNRGSPYSRWLVGIVYAADQGADVINLSGSPTFEKSENPGIVAATERAVNYAFRKGTLLVTVAHNDAVDLDHNGDAVRLPCEAANAICVSATGPTAAAGVNGPWENVDAPAQYTAFGRSAVDVAAPGGAGVIGNPDPVSSGTQFRRMWVPCTTTPTENSVPACRAGQPIAQPFGTSFAAPHVSGLAALLVAQLGHGNPALIRSRILQSADDLGEPGTDPFYGKGRINVARALGLKE
jgi:subtilisin family serine protease